VELKIRVGAAVDRSLSEAYRPLILAAEQARAKIEGIGKRQARVYATETRRGASDAEKAFQRVAREAERWQRQSARDAEKAARDKARAVDRAAKDEVRAVEKAEREKTRIASQEEAKRAREQKSAERAARNAEKEMARVAAARQGRGVGPVADARWSWRQEQRLSRTLARGREEEAHTVRNVLGLTGRTLSGMGGKALRAGMGIARDVAGGAGVNFDLASMVQQNVAMETAATSLSNSGYIAGDKRNGTRVDPRALMNQAFQVGQATGTDANDALEGLSKFVAKTGDLQTGRDILKDMAVLAKATGTSLDDMVDAAGDVSTALPDGADKAERLRAVMQGIAGMGKVAAVEMKDFASQMAKIAANAGQFEGDASKNILTLSAMAQESRQRGGSASATQAATSVASFVSMLKTPARAKAFEAATGSKVFNKETGLLRDPQTIIKEALSKVGMDPIALKKVFQNSGGARAMEGFATIYRQAGGGAKGLSAVDAEFERLRTSAMADAEVLVSFQAALKTSEAQAATFNNQLRQSALQIQDALIPAMAQLAPAFVSLANQTAKVVQFMVGSTPGAKKTEAELDTSLDGAQKNTKKQLARGYILDAQKDANKDLERKAALNVVTRKSEADLAAENYQRERPSVGKTIAKGAMDAVGGALLGPAYNIFGLARDGTEAATATTKSDVDEKQQLAQRAQEQYEEIKGINERVADLLANGIIQVKVTEMPPAQATPPSVMSDGRQKSPDGG
jgi:hypothetical protein